MLYTATGGIRSNDTVIRTDQINIEDRTVEASFF